MEIDFFDLDNKKQEELIVQFLTGKGYNQILRNNIRIGELLEIINVSQLDYYSSKQCINEELIGSKFGFSKDGNPCTEMFERARLAADNASVGASRLFGSTVGIAIYTWRITAAVDAWCDCMEDTYGEGCE